MAYRTDALKGDKGAENPGRFLEQDQFPGQRSLCNLPRPTLEIALMADGVPPDQLCPLDVERAFKKLERIKPHIAIWWTSGGQSAQLISDGEVGLIQPGAGASVHSRPTARR
jgi:putative spermidine/putrescine transport system substrate-binding protein